MRKYLIPAAILVSSIAAAAPAAAQWAPSGNAYGYNNYGQGRRLEVRVMQLRREIRQLDVRNIIGHREAAALDAEARNLEFRIRQLGYNGLNNRERFSIEQRIARLEQNLRYRANNRNQRYGQRYDRDGNGTYDYNAERAYNGYDRDRDGRDDRYEDDRGRDRDD
jgi:hypothetical protein